MTIRYHGPKTFFCSGRYARYGFKHCESTNWTQCLLCMDYERGYGLPRYPVPALITELVLTSSLMALCERRRNFSHDWVPHGYNRWPVRVWRRT